MSRVYCPNGHDSGYDMYHNCNTCGVKMKFESADDTIRRLEGENAQLLDELLELRKLVAVSEPGTQKPDLWYNTILEKTS